MWCASLTWSKQKAFPLPGTFALWVSKKSREVSAFFRGHGRSYARRPTWDVKQSNVLWVVELAYHACVSWCWHPRYNPPPHPHPPTPTPPPPPHPPPPPPHPHPTPHPHPPPLWLRDNIELLMWLNQLQLSALWTSNGKKGSVKWRCEHAQSRGFLGNFVNLHNATS